MSSQKGNISRSRPQKHKNRTVFKNNLHDTSNRTKFVNSIQVSDVCMRCKEIIEWKIKYKKYKPLTQPKTCVKCSLKTVKQAYHVMCRECGSKLGLCTKCCQNKQLIQSQLSNKQQEQLDNEMKGLLQSLPERKRRTFFRYMNQKENDKIEVGDNDKEDLIKKLNELTVIKDDEFDFEDNYDEEHIDIP